MNSFSWPIIIATCTTRHPIIIIVTFYLQTLISEKRDKFQELILRVLYQEVIPEFKVLQDLDSNKGKTGQLFKAIIKYSIDYLCKSLSWLQGLTTKQTFCWGLVASSSSRVHVTAENFDWLRNYSYVISELGKLFNNYCTRKKLSDNQSVIVNSLPDDIAKSCCDDVTRYIQRIYVHLYRALYIRYTCLCSSITADTSSTFVCNR